MADYQYIVNTGTIIPDTSDIKSEVEGEYRQIFGQDFVVDDETPEGLLINGEVTSRQSVARNNARLANQINPDLAEGVFIDALWALTGGSRRAATKSTVTATISGVTGTSIPSGSLATVGEGGSEFSLTATTVIPLSGSIDAVFQSVLDGPVEAPATELNTIPSPGVLGWESITNVASATLGTSTQSDQQARNERRQTIGLQGRSVPLAVTSNVRALDGVNSLTFRENVTESTAIIDGITLSPKSIWVCVSGGQSSDIARALLSSKTVGADWNGSQSEVVVDPSSGQSYTVEFDRPIDVGILARVTVRASSAVPDPISAVRDAIVDYSNGLVGSEPGFVVGADVSPYELSWAISSQVPSLFVSLVEISYDNDPANYVSTTLNIDVNQQASITSGSIEVTVV